jgi:hypothetical protein
MAQCYGRSGQDIATGKSDTIGEAESIPLNVWHLRSHTSVHFDYTACAEWLPCQLIQTTVRTKPIRAACLATTVSATFPIQDRSACPSITFGLMNQIDRSLQCQRDTSRARMRTYFCCEAEDATGKNVSPPMTTPCCRARLTRAMIPTSGRR